MLNVIGDLKNMDQTEKCNDFQQKCRTSFFFSIYMQMGKFKIDDVCKNLCHLKLGKMCCVKDKSYIIPLNLDQILKA